MAVTDTEHLTVTWNDYGTVYRQMLYVFRRKNFLTDVTLACDGEKFLAHKLVLVTCSDFFKSILEDTPCDHPIIYLKGINSKDMKLLIDFMYLGKIDLPKENVVSVYSTAENLQIKGLGALSAENNFPLNSERCHKKQKVSDNYDDVNYIKEENSSATNFTGTSFPPLNQTEQLFYNQNGEYCNIDGDSAVFIGTNGNFIGESIPESVPPSTVSSAMCKSPLRENKILTPLTTLKSEHFESMMPLNYCLNKVKHKPNFDTRKIKLLEPTKVTKNDKALDFTFGTSSRLASSKSLPPLNESNLNPPIKETPEESKNVADDDKEVLFLKDIPPLEENMENVHGRGRSFTCPICKKIFAKNATQKRHYLAHFRPYKCHLCPRSFTRKEVLSEHILEHNGMDMRLPCPVCHMTIKRKRNLQAHIKVKHPEYYQQKLANNDAIC